MSQFAEIAFPTAVRKTFTYRVPKEQVGKIMLGVRVWVPLRQQYAIGVVVRLHDDTPSFKTKNIREVLDDEPILSADLLSLTEWIHHFYFCSWGEVIQAALPAGLNFVSRKKLRLSPQHAPTLLEDEQQVMNAVSGDKALHFEEAEKRWKGTALNKVFKSLLKRGVIEVWEEPDLAVTVKTERAWQWNENASKEVAKAQLSDAKRELKWHEALQVFLSNEGAIPNSKLDVYGISTYAINKLKDEGWIEATEVEVPSSLDRLTYAPDELKELNAAQENAFKSIEVSLQKGQFQNFLLKGITGSGKTEVYIHALKKALEMGKGGIVLVPEIALTPQTVSRFYRIFGEKIAVLHSRMTPRERLESWKKLQSGAKKIAIGPRSAIFSPVQNLGIIILDEEHDASYKQIDPSPRYHAREVAIMRASRSKAIVLLGSATPSMQALNMVAKDKATLLELTSRHEGAVLPDVEILDLKQYKHAMRGELAVPLFQAIEQAIEKKEQVIILYNRRGFANYLQCETCGHIPQSPECSVSLTYHKNRNQLICHYSGYSRKADVNCEHCGSNQLTVQGAGTQKIEEELEGLFPHANILRFDRDTTSRKGAHERILNRFANGEADILVGTQLVAKGLDFPNVTVVGVIDADTELAFPSFQSGERMFQLLSQVAGRSGRGEKNGKVYIQTRRPENEALKFAQTHDFNGFAQSELSYREALNYPPYSRLIKFVLKGKDEGRVQQAANILTQVLSKLTPDLETLGPSPAPIAWMNKQYIWEVMVKLSPEKGEKYIAAFLEKVMEVYDQHSASSSSAVRINVNVDAIR